MTVERDDSGADWERVELYGPDVRVWRDSAGRRFRVAVGDAEPTEFRADNREALEAFLIALTDVKRALTGEDFVPAKTMGAPRPAADGGVPVRFEAEDLEYLRARVRVGKEDSLDGAVSRAVKSYIRDVLHRQFAADAPPDAEAAAPARPPSRARKSQRTLPGTPQGLTGLGTTQLRVLQIARQKNFVTRLDVGRVYGVTARRGGAANARRRTDGYLNALVARNLLRYEPRPSGEPAWALTELGRVAVEEAGARENP